MCRTIAIMIRCALETWELSASNDVPTRISWHILPHLRGPEGRKSTKIAEISTPLTIPQMTGFSLFRENVPSAREICTLEYPVLIKNFFLDPKQTNGYGESGLQDSGRDKQPHEMWVLIPKFVYFSSNLNSPTFRLVWSGDSHFVGCLSLPESCNPLSP